MKRLFSRKYFVCDTKTRFFVSFGFGGKIEYNKASWKYFDICLEMFTPIEFISSQFWVQCIISFQTYEHDLKVEPREENCYDGIRHLFSNDVHMYV